jgi:hypothetical protein
MHVVDTSGQICRLPPIILLLSMINFGAVEVILMLRVWILWEKSRVIGILLTIVFFVGIILGVGLVHADIKVGTSSSLSRVSDLASFQYPFALAQFRELP